MDNDELWAKIMAELATLNEMAKPYIVKPGLATSLTPYASKHMNASRSRVRRTSFAVSTPLKI